ncbi:pyridoxamine 5'-phosphate oxidase family protein [Lachnospiraceae bacterium 54-53]
MKRNFSEQCRILFGPLKGHEKMVLSTASNDRVSSRMMSIIILNEIFYFQMDRTFRKYGQLAENPHAALCKDNVQVEGICEELGHPLKHPEFCALYKEHFPGSYERYTFLENERLFSLKPQFAQMWTYENGEPFILKFDFRTGEYEKIRYEAEPPVKFLL